HLAPRHIPAAAIDTTVQAKLLRAAIKGLTRLARKRGVRLRQSYVRIAKRAAMMAGRYAHAKQFNRPARASRHAHSRHPAQDRRQRGPRGGIRLATLACQSDPLAAAAPTRLEALSFRAPEVECIGKGKASAPYEFGVKASVVTTNARAPGGQFVLHAK